MVPTVDGINLPLQLEGQKDSCGSGCRPPQLMSAGVRDCWFARPPPPNPKPERPEILNLNLQTLESSRRKEPEFRRLASVV